MRFLWRLITLTQSGNEWTTYSKDKGFILRYAKGCRRNRWAVKADRVTIQTAKAEDMYARLYDWPIRITKGGPLNNTRAHRRFLERYLLSKCKVYNAKDVTITINGVVMGEVNYNG